MTPFDRYIGIDYSGAGEPTSRQSGLRVYVAQGQGAPAEVRPPRTPNRNWNRQELASWLEGALSECPNRVVAGLDHGFSFPLSYMRRHGLTTWDDFLRDFCRHWPTDTHAVEALRKKNARTGRPDEMRLTETWTPSAKSVFLFDVQGSVAKSTHAGIPWLAKHRARFGRSLHFWPFDGFDLPDNCSTVVEVYPSLFRRRYPAPGLSPDQLDARSIACWLQERDQLGFLPRYFKPALSPAEEAAARLEGWILGVA